MKWIEQFPGHIYLDIKAMDYEVHVCARGRNAVHPCAMLSRADGVIVFFKECKDLEEAKHEVLKAYRNRLIEALNELKGD